MDMYCVKIKKTFHAQNTFGSQSVYVLFRTRMYTYVDNFAIYKK